MKRNNKMAFAIGLGVGVGMTVIPNSNSAHGVKKFKIDTINSSHIKNNGEKDEKKYLMKN